MAAAAFKKSGTSDILQAMSGSLASLGSKWLSRRDGEQRKSVQGDNIYTFKCIMSSQNVFPKVLNNELLSI